LFLEENRPLEKSLDETRRNRLSDSLENNEWLYSYRYGFIHPKGKIYITWEQIRQKFNSNKNISDSSIIAWMEQIGGVRGGGTKSTTDP